MASEGALKAATEIALELVRWARIRREWSRSDQSFVLIRDEAAAIIDRCMAPAPSPGVTSEQVRVDCKACGGEQVEHTCHRKWKTIRNKSEAGVTSEQVGRCPRCSSTERNIRRAITTPKGFRE